MTPNAEQEHYISQTLELAKQGELGVAPNPMVGAVLVKEGRIIGKGFHKAYGGAHAEVEAINDACEDVEGATLYCNLEPCCHTNKQTPPCTKLIIQKKIKKVVICNLDPNPEVSGKGLLELKQAGIEVESGVLEDRGEKLNEVFFTFMRKKRPFIHLKAAQTLDGKICCMTGDSKWISSEAARKEVHFLRQKYQAIAVGKSTLVTDDPSLNVRSDSGEQIGEPLRVLFAKEKELSSDLKIFRSPQKNLFSEGRNIQEVLDELFHKKVSSLLLEGGEGLLSSFLSEGLFDRITLYIRPILLGNGKSVFKSSKKTIAEALALDLIEWRRVDDHIVFEGRPKCLQD